MCTTVLSTGPKQLLNKTCSSWNIDRQHDDKPNDLIARVP